MPSYCEFMDNHYTIKNDVKKMFFQPIKHMKEHQQRLLKFLKWRDAPPWYQGLSIFQINAAKRLHIDLRDDSEQQTTHRVYDDLVAIGLSPIYPSSEEITEIIKLSQINDLAFLWFLWEQFYKSKNNNYTINERLILSAIVELDIVPTLRELDRILPLPQPSKSTSIESEELRRLKEIEKRQFKQLNHFVKIQNAKYKFKKNLPYFQPLSMPRHYGKSLNIKKPDFRVSLPEFRKSKDPVHKEPNETNRWFGKYELQPSKRIATRILKNEMDTLMSTDKQRPFHKLMKSLIGETFETLLSTNVTVKEQYCTIHKQRMEEKEMRRQKKLVEQRDRCLKQLNTEHTAREKRRERIINQLNCDTEKFIIHYKKKLGTNCRDCLMELLSDTFICAIHLIEENCHKDKMATQLCEEEMMEHEGISSSLATGDILIEKYSSGQRICYPNREINMENNFNNNDKCDTTSSTSDPYETKGGGYCKSFKRSKKDMINFTPNVCTLDDPDLYNYDHTCKQSNSLSSSRSSQEFFAANNENLPFHINYGKVFYFQNDENNNDSNDINIKKYIVETLDGKIEQCKTLQNNNDKINDAIDRLVKTLFKKLAAIKREEMEEEERQRLANIANERLTFDRDYYDPYDRKLMINMLKTAILRLRKNRSLVLVTLPKAYMLPILIEWISARYGKVYTKEKQRKLCQSSKQMHITMQRLTQICKVHIKQSDIASNSFVPYSCHDYMLKKFARVKNKFLHRYHARIMLESRIYWFLLRSLLCSPEPLNKTFFAYLPPKVADIHIMRIWKHCEFKNYRLIRSRLASN